MYFPVTPNRSGEILAAGQMQAAQTNAQAMQGLGQDIGGAIAGLAGSYAEGKALEAKGVAYGDFLKSHGQQLGFQPDYLESLLKKKPRELAMIGDQIVGFSGGNVGNRMMALNHLNRQAELYPGRGAGGAGGGAGGGQKGYMPGQGWVGYGN